MSSPGGEIRRGDRVLWYGRTYLVDNVRTDQHNGPPVTTAKLRRHFKRDQEIVYCAPVEELEKVEDGRKKTI